MTFEKFNRDQDLPDPIRLRSKETKDGFVPAKGGAKMRPSRHYSISRSRNWGGPNHLQEKKIEIGTEAQDQARHAVVLLR